MIRISGGGELGGGELGGSGGELGGGGGELGGGGGKLGGDGINGEGVKGGGGEDGGGGETAKEIKQNGSSSVISCCVCCFLLFKKNKSVFRVVAALARIKFYSFYKRKGCKHTTLLHTIKTREEIDVHPCGRRRRALAQ